MMKRLAFLFAICGTLIGNAQTASAEPTQRWLAIQKMAQALPENNPDEDPDLLKSISKETLLLPLADCEAAEEDMQTIAKLIEIFETGRALEKSKQYSYISERLDKFPGLSWKDRTELKMGAKMAADMTVASLRSHSCRSYLESLFLLGMTKKQIVDSVNETSLAKPTPATNYAPSTENHGGAN